ncbi:MAG: hypothetical protein RMJ49_04765 [Bacteroidia bacterium]|nr:hypothetical protein [Bacteroidia bacterium]
MLRRHAVLACFIGLLAAQNVGIGTSTPAERLHVYDGRLRVSHHNSSSDYATSLAGLQIQNLNANVEAINGLAFQNAGGFYIGGIAGLPLGDPTINNGGELAFWTKVANGSSLGERMRITHTGLVGIGVPNPFTRLEVYDHDPTDAFIGGSFTLSAGGGPGRVTRIDFRPWRGRPGGPAAAIRVIDDGNFSAYLALFTAPSGNAGNNLMVERMRILPNGNIGIGNTNPDHLLVVGPAGGGRHLVINDVATARWGFATGGHDLAFQNDWGGNWTTRVIFTEVGNVGIGTITPDARLHVSGGLVALGVRDEAGAYAIPNTCGGNWIANATSGIYAPEPGPGGCGDEWYIASYPRSGEARTLEIAIRNDADDHLALMPSGNVGIGTNSPSHRLHVIGETRISSLSGTGNRPVYADADGVLRAGAPNQNALWTLHGHYSHSVDDWCTGCTGTGSLPDNVDDFTQVVTLPFGVTINGITYTEVSICSNGWIAFGSTTSTSYSNTCLPTDLTSLPTIFPYWDDLRDYGGGEWVRWGTVGTAPNRVFIVDYNMRQYGNTDANVRVNFMVLIHEGTNHITVKYRDAMHHTMNGQSATIGFQLQGGASAKAYGIVCNGKVLDDNRDDGEGWSVSPVR